nr:FAD-dependent monooxygenase [Agromyces laixinhei]
MDMSAEPGTRTRALGMQARTLELFELHGIVEALLERGLRADRFNVFSERRRILRADLSELPTAYPYLLMIPQNEAETIMADRLADHAAIRSIHRSNRRRPAPCWS